MAKTVQINIAHEVTEEFLSDLLVGAFDAQYGGCWSWAQPVITATAWEIEGEVWRAVNIIDSESGRTFKVDHDLLIKGILKLFEEDVLPRRGDIRNAVLQNNAGEIDSEGASVIVQLACFGELVYG